MIFGFLRPNELSVIERCPYYRGVCKERLHCKYVKGVPFVNRGYMKEVPLLPRMVHKKVRGWTSGQSLPVVEYSPFPWHLYHLQSQTQPTKYSADPVFVVCQLSFSCGSYAVHSTLSRENKLHYYLLTLYVTMFFLRVLWFPPLLENRHLQIPIRPGIRTT